MFIKKILFSVLLCLLSLPGFAENPPEVLVEARLISEQSNVKPGQVFWLGLELTMAPGWHTYYKDPGDSGYPTTIIWNLPSGLEAGEIHWPKPKQYEFFDLINNGYEDQVLLLIPITAESNLAVDQNIELKATAQWLACKDTCIPGSAELSLSLPVSNQDPQPNTEHQQAFAQSRSSLMPLSENVALGDAQSQATGNQSGFQGGFLLALIFAFIGGLILNLMPCVLPVLSLKVMSFIKQAKEDPKKIRMHGLVFTLGILLSFWALSGALLALRATGEQLGWGFQLQSPNFIMGLIIFLFVFGLNLFGLFEMGTGLVSLSNLNTSKSEYGGSFLSGVLATVVATPCTAPFMGSALGYALTLSPYAALLIFSALALGLAFPYLLLSFNPKWMRFVPKPGAWMESFKQAMGFPLMATVIWLFSVLLRQVDSPSAIRLLFSLLIISLGLWIFGKWDTPMNSKRLWARVLSLVLIAQALLISFKPKGSDTDQIQWQNFSPALQAQAIEEGKAVFVDFTAAWCLTCKVNKRIFKKDNVIAAFKQKGIVALSADWTNKDPIITKELAKFERSGVPFYVYYAPGSQSAVTLPELLTEEIVLEAIG